MEWAWHSLRCRAETDLIAQHVSEHLLSGLSERSVYWARAVARRRRLPDEAQSAVTKAIQDQWVRCNLMSCENLTRDTIDLLLATWEPRTYPLGYVVCPDLAVQLITRRTEGAWVPRCAVASVLDSFVSTGDDCVDRFQKAALDGAEDRLTELGRRDFGAQMLARADVTEQEARRCYQKATWHTHAVLFNSAISADLAFQLFTDVGVAATALMVRMLDDNDKLTMMLNLALENGWSPLVAAALANPSGVLPPALRQAAMEWRCAEGPKSLYDYTIAAKAGTVEESETYLQRIGRIPVSALAVGTAIHHVDVVPHEMLGCHPETFYELGRGWQGTMGELAAVCQAVAGGPLQQASGRGTQLSSCGASRQRSGAAKW